jgi:hypothetical protein
LDRFSGRVREGDLTNTVNRLAALRTDVATRLLKPLDYDPAQLRIEDIPASLSSKPAVSYMHDFVPPVIGQNRAYVDMMREHYMALTETELSGVVLRYSWETVWGGGPVPEMFNLSEIRSPTALLQLVGKEIPGEYKQIGSWMRPLDDPPPAQRYLVADRLGGNDDFGSRHPSGHCTSRSRLRDRLSGDSSQTQY